MTAGSVGTHIIANFAGTNNCALNYLRRKLVILYLGEIYQDFAEKQNIVTELGSASMRRLGRKVNLMKPANVDKLSIERYLFFANAYVIELPLDAQPDYVWQTLFEQEWKADLQLWDRKVTVVGDKLLLITTLAEIEDKIDWLIKVIESTNTRVEEFNKTREVIEEAKKEEELRRDTIFIRDVLRSKLTYV